MSIPHWQYFLAIEADLIKCCRYVEFDPKNFGTYSVEFARIIVSAASEFDTVAKSICKAIQPNSNPQRIGQYKSIILSKYPRFVDYLVEIPSYKLTFQPWKDWATKSPDWWSKSYNKIKHHREQHFEAANLQHAIEATTGLLVGLIYLYDALHGQFPGVDYVLSPQLLEPLEPSGTQGGSITWTCSAWK